MIIVSDYLLPTLYLAVFCFVVFVENVPDNGDERIYSNPACDQKEVVTSDFVRLGIGIEEIAACTKKYVNISVG